jgi:hypothetical protein
MHSFLKHQAPKIAHSSPRRPLFFQRTRGKRNGLQELALGGIVAGTCGGLGRVASRAGCSGTPVVPGKEIASPIQLQAEGDSAKLRQNTMITRQSQHLLPSFPCGADAQLFRWCSPRQFGAVSTPIAFSGNGGTLQIDCATDSVTGQISGFTGGDYIDARSCPLRPVSPRRRT